MKVLDHLGQLETAGLVRVAQVMPDLEYLFRHALVQEAIYASILDADQQRLHQDVGETLEKLYRDQIEEMAATLAEHFEKARDMPRALKYHRAAAERAATAYANREAENHYRRAVELANTEEQRADLLASLGEVLFHQSRYFEAEQTWQEAIRLYRDLNNCDLAARLQARCARGAWFAGTTPRSLQLCLDGLEAAVDAPESEGQAVLIHEAARASYFNAKPEQASRLCRRALDLAERLGSIEVQADALTTLAILPDTPPEEALSALHKAVELAEPAGLLHIASRALVNLGNAVQFHLGDYQAARSHFLHSVELARRRGALSEEVIPLVSAAAISINMGNVAEAEEFLDDVKHIQNSLTDPGTIQIAINALQSALHTIKGEFNEALTLLRKNMDEARQHGDLQNLVQSSHELLGLLIKLDYHERVMDWSEADHALVDLLKTDIGGVGKQAYSLSLACMIKAHQRQFSEAEIYLERARQEVVKHDLAWGEIPILQAEFELAYMQGHWSDALTALEGLSKYRDRIGLFGWGRVLTLWAVVLMRRTDPDDLEQAQVLLLEARTVFEKLDSRFYIEYTNQKIAASREQTYAQAKAQKKVSQELRQAGVLQSSFLPQKPPNLPGWQVSAAIKPVRTTSGDFYDFILLSTGKLGIVIADVADKGIGAALFMTSTRTLIRAYTEEYPDNPELALAAANRRITRDTHGGLFITLFYGLLNPANGDLTYCNAGHNPPFILQADGHQLELAGTGYPLGIFEEANWRADTVHIEPGGLLVLYTDGVTEAENPKAEMFGNQRLFQAAASTPVESTQRAHQAQAAILQAVQEFSGGEPQGDDITLVVLSRE